MMFETLEDHHCNFFLVLDVFNILCIMIYFLIVDSLLCDKFMILLE